MKAQKANCGGVQRARRFVVRDGMLVEVCRLVPSLDAARPWRLNPLWREARTALEFKLEARA